MCSDVISTKGRMNAAKRKYEFHRGELHQSVCYYYTIMAVLQCNVSKSPRYYVHRIVCALC
jgi:hypothetical protein